MRGRPLIRGAILIIVVLWCGGRVLHYQQQQGVPEQQAGTTAVGSWLGHTWTAQVCSFVPGCPVNQCKLSRWNLPSKPDRSLPACQGFHT